MAPRKQGQKKEFEGIKSLRISSVFATNEAKLKSLCEHFNVVHLVKNEMSEHVLANKHLLLTKDGRYELSSQHYKRFSTDELSAWETQQIFADVTDMYVNSLKKRKSNQPFTVQSKFEVIRYKKDIKSKSGEVVARKGDVKTFEIKKKKTLLTKLASKLISLDPKQFDSFVIMPPQPKENEAPETFKKRFDKVVEENKYIESLKRNEPFWQRLKAVLKHRQRNILSCLKLVEYSSGSYRKAVREGAKTAAKCSHVIKTDNAEYKYYYRFKIAKKEVIYIPLAINEKYHDFEHVNFDAAAYVSLNRKGHLNVGLQYTKGVSFVEHTPITGVVGLDLNVKDNFITVAYHNRSASYDYDRQLIKQLVDGHRDLDKRGYKNLCELNKARLKKLRGRAEAYFRSVISRVLNDFEANDISDIIMEDLHFSRKVGGGFSGEFGIKFNRLIRMLRLSSIKTWFREQANNRGIKVHFVNPAFSSQQCCKCHFVHRNNRDQQQFDCVVCGHKEHADVNAAKVIRLRFIEDVLRKSLFEVEKGIVGRQLCGKKISKFAVKKVVDKLYKAA